MDGGIFDNDPINSESAIRLLRGLKGGSGGSGGGGGGGRGGGSSYGGSSYGGNRGSSYYGTNSSSGGGGSVPTGVIIGIVVVGVLGLIFYFYYKNTLKRNANSAISTPTSIKSFEEAVTKAKGKQSDQATFNSRLNPAGSPTPHFETYDAEFDVQYQDRSSILSSVVKIQLRKNGLDNGYQIEGEVKDADGRANIIEGNVLFSGEAWWIEETQGGADNGLKVLTEGKFDFTANTFAGTWRASTGIHGRYIEFKGKNISQSFSPQAEATTAAGNPQSLEQQLEIYIPVVDAKVESPVVQAAPVVQAMPETATMPTVSAVVATPSSVPPIESAKNQGK